MSLVDITTLSAEDQIMESASKQYVDSNLAIAESRSDTKLAEFRASIEAFTARADEREAAAREREAAARERDAIRARAFEKRMEDLAARADEREAAAREREAAARERDAIRARGFEKRMEDLAARANEREAAAREHEAIRSREFEKRMENSEARSDRIERRLDQIESSINSLKKYVVGASLSTVLGVGAFNAALIQNYHAAFDSARHLTAAERDLTAQRQRTDALLSAMEARLAAIQKTGGQNNPPP